MRSRVCAAIVFLSTVAATPWPSPTPPSHQLSAFSGTATMSLKAIAASKTATITVHGGFSHRGAFTRIDIIDASALANSGSQAMTMPFGGLHVVIDAARGTFALWSAQSTRYYSGRFGAGHSHLSPANAIGGLGALTQLSLFNFSLDLAGNQMVNGQSVSVFEFAAKTQKRGAATSADIAGHVDLGDDVSGFPIHADMTIASGATTTVTVTMDVTALFASVPPLSEFAPPKGYKRTSRVSDVLASMAMHVRMGPRRPLPVLTPPANPAVPSPSPVPSPQPTPGD